MLNNNNKAVINRLYRKMLKQNKLRNRVTILAIILTTFMFTAIFTMGFSLAENLNEMLLRQQGTKSSIYLDNPSEKQIEEVRKLETVEAAGIRINVGSASDINKNNSYNLYYYDDTEFEDNLGPAITNIKGKYPANENEIMMPKSVLTTIGSENPKINQKINLIVDGKKTQFVLSGWYDGFSISNPVLVSRKYATKIGCDIKNNGQLCISAKNGNVYKLSDELERNIKLQENQEWDRKYDVQEEGTSNRIITILTMCLISILIVISGYLLIYNVMYISVAKDIRFYGMLKTIGTSASQIRTLVKKQTAHLAFIGIIIGAICGTIASFGIVPLAMTLVTSNRTPGIISNEIDFNPLIYVFAVAFAVVTVYLGVRKPAKIAGKVSPVEALKYQSGKNEKIKKYKVSKKGKVFSMAYRNVFRDKKRCRLVFASLFFGTMIFLCVNTFIRCLDADSYLENYFYNDYVLYTNDEPVHEDRYLGEAQGTMKTMEDVAEEIENIPGIAQVQINRHAVAILPFDAELYKPFLEREMNQNGMTAQQLIESYESETDPELMYSSNVVSVDSKMIELYNKKARQKIDIESFEKGEVCLMGYPDTVEQSDAMLNKTITLENPDTKVQKSIEVGAAPTYEESYGITCGYYWTLVGAPGVILVSDNFMKELFPNAEINCIIADAKWGHESKVTPEIQRIIKDNIIIGGTDIRSVEGKEFKNSLMSLTVIGDSISIILILIGLINFINVMLTGVYTRNNELAILESVGMTKKQIKKMLVLEGSLYGIITVALIWTLGSGMMYGTGELCKMMADYASMHYSVGLVIVVSIFILLICTVVPVIVFKEISKRTVTERLRLGEV